MAVRPSNFTAAVGPIRLGDLRCPHCGACNRDAIVYVELENPGCAVCRVCGRTSRPETSEGLKQP